MVVISRIPLSAAKRKVRISEILFYAPVKRTDIPPQRPELVLLVHDRAVCTSCTEEICSCRNTLGIRRGSLADLAPKSSCSSGPCNSPCMKMPWEDRMRMMYHGSKRGLLTLFYSIAAGDFPRITVRQAYVSSCANQDAIAFRIQQQLTSLLSKLPRPDSAHMRSLGMDPGGAAPPGLPANDECSMAFSAELSQSPVSFTPLPSNVAALSKDGVWFEPPKLKPALPESKPKQNACNGGKSGCCLKPTAALEPKCGSIPTQCNTNREQGNVNTSAGSLPSMRSGGDSYSRDHTMQNSVCGPEKAGMECECSAESMPDRSLALILNSRRDRPVNPAAEMNEFVEPIMEPASGSATSGGGVIMQPVPSIGHGSAEGVLREEERTGLEHLGRPVQFGSQSPESGRLGSGAALPSPLPPPPLLPGEPLLKRPRADPSQRADVFNLGLDPGWSTGLDEQKGIQLPSWNMTAMPERPLSVFGRALGMARSPSPLALMTNVHKTPSPRTLAPSGTGLGFPKPLNQECDFQNPFESSVAMAEGELTAKHHNGTVNGHSHVSSQGPKRGGSPLGGSRNTSEGAVTNGSEVSSGNGTCCEICGISFAKRSNKMRHIQTVHNRLKQFECDLCGQKFGLKADLGRHRYRIHESRAFSCDRCGKSFAEQSQLELHIRVTHEEDSRPWECKQCRIRFGRKSSLTRHEQTVHQRTRFTCRVCNKTYSQKFDAVRHERKMHDLHGPTG